MLSNDVLKSLIYQVQQTLVSRPRLFSTLVLVYFSRVWLQAPGRSQRGPLWPAWWADGHAGGNDAPCPRALGQWQVGSGRQRPWSAASPDGQLWLSRHSRGPLMRVLGTTRQPPWGCTRCWLSLPPFSALTTSTVLPGIAFQVTVTVSRVSQSQLPGDPSWDSSSLLNWRFGPTLAETKLHGLWVQPISESREDYDLWGHHIWTSWKRSVRIDGYGAAGRQEVMSVVRGTRLGKVPEAWVWSPSLGLPCHRGVTHICCESWGKSTQVHTEPLCSLQEDQVSERTWRGWKAQGRWSSFGFKLP